MEVLVNSVLLVQPLGVADSTGYADCANAALPLGRLIFAPSQINAFELAHAK